jgi:AraC-like DNA-binding protein
LRDRYVRTHTPPVHTSAVHRDRDMALIALPRAEVHLVVRFGSSARRGLDVHALGPRVTAHRKIIRGGQRTLTARLPLGASEALLGVQASVLAGRPVPLEDLWGDAATERLLDRVGAARDTRDAAAILERTIEDRFAATNVRSAHEQLVLDAAERLAHANVSVVAGALGVSERHLRRVFREAVGLSPKAYAKVARFHRALRAAQRDGRASWASIAAATGYYDQAHLIDEFRSIAGVTPRMLLGEIGRDVARRSEKHP